MNPNEYRAPLSKEDAETIMHAIEVRVLQASLPESGVEIAARYGEARHWMTALFRGESVEIPEKELSKSRAIMQRGRF